MCSTRAPGVPRLLAWLLGPLALFRLSPAQGCVPGLTKWVGWGRLRESNSRPTHYECVALPSELRRRVHGRRAAHARSPTISTLRAHVEAAARAASPAATADGQLSTGGTQTSHRRAQEGGRTPAHERPPGERRDHERPAEPLPRAHPGERSGAGPPVVTAAATRPIPVGRSGPRRGWSVPCSSPSAWWPAAGRPTPPSRRRPPSPTRTRAGAGQAPGSPPAARVW